MASLGSFQQLQHASGLHKIFNIHLQNWHSFIVSIFFCNIYSVKSVNKKQENIFHRKLTLSFNSAYFL